MIGKQNYSYIAIIIGFVNGGIHILSSCDADFINSSIIYILSHSTERYCLDVQYVYGALLGEVIKYSKREGGMEWFSISYRIKLSKL